MRKHTDKRNEIGFEFDSEHQITIIDRAVVDERINPVNWVLFAEMLIKLISEKKSPLSTVPTRNP